MLKIGIFGFGAVGSSIYNELKDYKELYILVDEIRKTKYQKMDLIINNQRIYPKFITSGIMDVIILSIKNYDLYDSLKEIKKFVGKNTTILPLLNGIDAHDILQDYFKYNNVLYGIINVESNKNNNICNTSKIYLIEFGNKYNFKLKYPLLELRHIFQKYNINNAIPHNMIRSMWNKWTLNLGINQLSALYNISYKEMNTEKYLNILFNVFDEVYKVSLYYNIGLTKEDINHLKKRCLTFESDRVTSLTLDFYNKDKNEMDVFGKKFISLAKNANIDVKTNIDLYNKLKEKSHH